MAMAKQEEVNVWMRLQILLRKYYERFLVFSLIFRLTAIRSLQSATLSPLLATRYAPSRMNHREQSLGKFVMEKPAEDLKGFVCLAQSVSMSQEKLLAVDFCCQRLPMQYDATLPCQIVTTPDVVIAGEEMDLDTQVCQLGEFPQEPGKTLWYYHPVFIPEIKHITQEINGCRLVLDTVQEVHETAFLQASMADRQRAEMCIREKINRFHACFIIGSPTQVWPLRSSYPYSTLVQRPG